MSAEAGCSAPAAVKARPKTAACVMERRGARRLIRAEENLLVSWARQGDLRARRLLIEAHLPLVRSIARQQLRTGLELRDLTQEGVIGLIQAIDKFDPHRRVRFATYASWWVRQAIQRAIVEGGRPIRLPASAIERLREVDVAETNLTAAFGRSPRMSELCSATGLTREEIVDLRFAAKRPASLDATPNEGEGHSEPVADREDSDPERAFSKRDVRRTLRQALTTLGDPRQAKIIELHYGIDGHEPKSLNEIGNMLGLTAARVCQLKHVALAALRSARTAQVWRETAEP